MYNSANLKKNHTETKCTKHKKEKFIVRKYNDMYLMASLGPEFIVGFGLSGASL